MYRRTGTRARQMGERGGSSNSVDARSRQAARSLPGKAGSQKDIATAAMASVARGCTPVPLSKDPTALVV
ncbi:hypothetical protein NEUTE1DRAFT_103301 [Neurospora tetrasperma FGSC 2508]|uniref:Uncharacterized protein n=1 Tax=Neurospora tetrasperma (strain FGSC 2508 / ATCC MYA-4615 / P0657) TaxID=510951 RepID=F8MSG8_NEUT8|nr:uncharacterized protein NEUTE1DRAFT_103301 [Neurospora tetrasperma FGSC 2508]EGO55908.1 hypothetical protein NEUTE1DRAFT_103301 [Neurospora tetrasperma FGSC 2508]